MGKCNWMVAALAMAKKKKLDVPKRQRLKMNGYDPERNKLLLGKIQMNEWLLWKQKNKYYWQVCQTCHCSFFFCLLEIQDLSFKTTHWNQCVSALWQQHLPEMFKEMEFGSTEVVDPYFAIALKMEVMEVDFTKIRFEYIYVSKYACLHNICLLARQVLVVPVTKKNEQRCDLNWRFVADCFAPAAIIQVFSCFGIIWDEPRRRCWLLGKCF